MALTIIKTGSTISTEKLVVQVTSDDPAVTSVIMNVRLVTGIDAHTLEHQPIFGSTNVFQFEVNSILKDYFNFEFQALTGAGTTVIENVISRLLFNEVISGVIQGVDYTTSAIIQNITQDVFEIEDFSFADYDCGTLGTTASKFLTSAPNPLVMGDNTSNFLSVLETSYTGTPGSLTPDQEWVKLDFDSLGALVNTTLTPVSVPVRSIDGAQLIGVYDIDTLRIDMDTSTGVVESRVYIRDILTPFTLRSETRIYKVNDACEKSITLSWYNELGTQDSFTFLGNITRSGKYTDSTFKRVRPVNPLSTNVGDLVYKSSYNYEYDLFSDRMPENAVQWLSNILINKRAAIQIEAVKPSGNLNLVSDDYFGSMPEFESYRNLVDGGNGFAYGAPDRSGNFIKFNLSTDVITTIASPYPANAQSQYLNGIRSNVNGKIYYMNNFPTTTDVLVFDTTLETSTTIGVLTNTIGQPCITPAGIIYAPIDGGNSKFFKIDTNTDIITEITSGATSGGGGCVYANGFVYFIPTGGATEFYKLDVSNDSITVIAAPLLTGSIYSPVITSTGLIYCVMLSLNLNEAFIIDTSNDTSQVVDTLVTTGSGYFSAFLMPDDNVYFLGRLEPDVLKIDTSNNSITQAGTITAHNYTFNTVIGSSVYSISPDQFEPILKLTFEFASQAKTGKYFPIVIDTDKTVLEDKFAPETLFRLKFRLANERKGLK